MLSKPFATAENFAQERAALMQKGYTHVPLYREALADLDTPVSTYLKLAHERYTYLFESVQGGSTWGRYSIIGLPCDWVYRVIGNEFRTEFKGEVIDRETVEDPLKKIQQLHAERRVYVLEELPETIGGLVGYFGYESVAYIEPRLEPCLRGKTNSKEDPIGAPDVLLMCSEDVVVFDNLSGRIYMVTMLELADEHAFAKAESRLDENFHKMRHANIEQRRNVQASHKLDYEVHFPQPDFERAVEKCRDYIKEGDIMQVLISQRQSVDFGGEAIDVYRALRMINPSPYMYYLHLEDFEIVGSSPEILVRLQDKKVTVRPIAGTRRRGDTLVEDMEMEKELLSDAKELAEHLMLIDLGRNDVGRIAKTGSVELTEKMVIERYSHVMHIVSNVEGELLDDMDAIDVLRATFPAGTVSGAPKIRAMEIIAELEQLKRGVYAGAVGYLGWNGNMDTAIAIRTAVVKDGKLHVQAAAGIVADSVPRSEWLETMSKSKAMFKAVEMAVNDFETIRSDANGLEANRFETNGLKSKDDKDKSIGADDVAKTVHSTAKA